LCFPELFLHVHHVSNIFAIVAYYGFNWSNFTKAESLNGVPTAGGH